MQAPGWSRSGVRTLRPAWSSVGLVLVLGGAALVPPVRPFLLMALVVAYGLARVRDRLGATTTALAAVLPVAAILAWGAFPQPLAAANGSDCTDPLSPPVVWRLLEAIVGLAVLALVAIDRRTPLADLGVRLGSRRNALVALIALVATVPAFLLGGDLLGQPGVAGSFFGGFSLDLSRPAALVPAAVFAVSNGLAEELSYRGAMRVWLAPSLGVVGANVGQAIVFGLAHTGQDFVGPVLPTAAAMVAAGFVAGVIGRRTGSLAIAVAVHVAADIPLFFYWACRAG